MPVNEVSGYRKFGGCLDVYYGCASRAKYDGDIKTKREDHKIKYLFSTEQLHICTFKIIYRKGDLTLCVEL